MSDHYLGLVEHINTAESRGRIRPIRLLKRRGEDGRWVVDQSTKGHNWGRDEQIRWNKVPPNQTQLLGCYVRFQVERDQKSLLLGRQRESYRVATPPGAADHHPVETHSLWLVISLNAPRGATIPLDSGIRLPVGSIVYRSYKSDSMIDGPWQVTAVEGNNQFLQPQQPHHVFEYSTKLLDGASYLRRSELGGSHSVLLAEPTNGTTIDLLPDHELPAWLLATLAHAESGTSHLDRAMARWSNRAAEAIAAISSPRRELDAKRLDRLRERLDLLDHHEAVIAALIDLPHFQQCRDDAIARQVDARRDEIEVQVRAEAEKTRAEVDRTLDERRGETMRYDHTIAKRLRQVESLHSEIKELERLRQEHQADLESISQRRVIAEFLAHAQPAAVIPRGGGEPEVARLPSLEPAASMPVVAEILPQEDSHSSVLVDSMTFVRERLTPILKLWGTGAGEHESQILHAALLACQWVAAPCPSWGVAYAEALGGAARHLVVHTEPTWLTFQDAWSGEIGPFWRRAIDQPDEWHLLIVADADRALIQCWAAPLLEVSAGLRVVIPTGLPWPKNLRLVTCPAPDPAVLPVPDWVVAHWAGVQARPDQAAAVLLSTLDKPTAGHVPQATWQGWTLMADDGVPLNRSLGRAARAAQREESALVAVLRALGIDEPVELARRVREQDARALFSTPEAR